MSNQRIDDDDSLLSFDRLNLANADLARADAELKREQAAMLRAEREFKFNAPPVALDWVSCVARLAHEVNRAYCQALGDESQPAWEDAPEWQRSSAINGVKFHRDNPDAGPDHSHNEWLKEKEAAGWGWGPVKDAELKLHPCFVPYDQLPPEQKAKDYLFRGVVHAMRQVGMVAVP